MALRSRRPARLPILEPPRLVTGTHVQLSDVAALRPTVVLATRPTSPVDRQLLRKQLRLALTKRSAHLSALVCGHSSSRVVLKLRC